MRIFLGVLGVLLFAAAASIAFYLLNVGKFSGAEFTAFVVAFAVLAMVIAYAPEVQEISIAGNVVKLKEVKAEALKAIDSLNKSRIDMLRVFLGLALKHSGGFASSSPIDPRARDFWKLLDQIREYRCFDELKDELKLSVSVLLFAQIGNIAMRNRDERISTAEPYLDPLELASIAFDVKGIQEAEAATSPKPENYRGEIKEALAEYAKLFDLQAELNK
ncbi:hypothetical protein POF45_00050 [Pseudomonas sp. 681]|uniref:Uncharacterized protein n=1 Tax=Pseudomonas fungipugnans TaxID=3024217 RepID=A0ABT6QG18_9PSED|nr:hypothetical protein [Pseudomonas sp. 681]MDI2589825.1 hypothetical protein [Pseudomonas sp. 681]